MTENNNEKKFREIQNRLERIRNKMFNLRCDIEYELAEIYVEATDKGIMDKVESNVMYFQSGFYTDESWNKIKKEGEENEYVELVKMK